MPLLSLDADDLRSLRKSEDVPWTRTPRPRAVWHKLDDDATHLGDDASRVV